MSCPRAIHISEHFSRNAFRSDKNVLGLSRYDKLRFVKVNLFRSKRTPMTLRITMGKFMDIIQYLVDLSKNSLIWSKNE